MQVGVPGQAPNWPDLNETKVGPTSPPPERWLRLEVQETEVRGTPQGQVKDSRGGGYNPEVDLTSPGTRSPLKGFSSSGPEITATGRRLPENTPAGVGY